MISSHLSIIVSSRHLEHLGVDRGVSCQVSREAAAFEARGVLIALYVDGDAGVVGADLGRGSQITGLHSQLQETQLTYQSTTLTISMATKTFSKVKPQTKQWLVGQGIRNQVCGNDVL